MAMAKSGSASRRSAEAAMERRPFFRQRPVVLLLTQRPQYEALADRQTAGAAQPGRSPVWETPGEA